MDDAVEIARLGQVLGRAQQHGGVAVMAAGMHHALGRAAIRDVVQFLDRQGIHVGAQADGAVAGAVAQHAHHAGDADAAMHLDAPGFELAGDDLGGAMFGHAEFGMGVEILPDGGQFGMVAANGIEGGHGGSQGSVASCCTLGAGPHRGWGQRAECNPAGSRPWR